MSIPEFPSTPILLVDADVLAYRAAAVAEKTKYLVEHNNDPTMPKEYDWIMKFDDAKSANAHMKEAEAFGWPSVRWSRKDLQPVEFALACADGIVESFNKRFPGCIIGMRLSGERNFRDFIWATKKYKGNRTAERPTHLKAVQDHLVAKYAATISNGVEADDDIVMEHFKNGNESTVICSIDKDLDQAWGWHWDWVEDKTYYVAPKDADVFLFEQIISGDAVDNIPGLPGWGKVKARKYLSGCESRKQVLAMTVAVYKQEMNHETTDYFMEQGSLCFIRRKEGQTFEDYLKDF